MFDVDLAFPLSAGLVAAFNPCGFAMLPAYTSYFLGLESDDETNVGRNVLRALLVGVTMTLGFIAVFGLVGLLTSTLISESALSSRVPWVTVVFGILMIPLGIAMLNGFEPKVNFKRLQAGGKNAQLPSIFLFGVSYAIVSISCTIGIFLSVVIGSFGRDGVIDGTARLVAYAVGMGLVIMVLTLSLALARTSVASNMRKVLPYVNKVSGVLLIFAGMYMATYGIWEIQINRGSEPWGWVDYIVDQGESVQTRVNNWINDVGEGRLALAITVILAGALVWALSNTMQRRQDRTMVRGAFVAVWALLEVIRYDFDLLVLPVVRTIADIPERIGNWFTDPFRWPVLFEIIALSLVGVVVYFSGRRRLAKLRTVEMTPAADEPANA